MSYWEQHPHPTDADIDAVARAWISYQRRTAREGSGAEDAGGELVIQVGISVPIGSAFLLEDDGPDDPDWWAAEAVMEADEESLREVQWRLIVAICELAEPNDAHVLGMVGASPLEDFIVHGGPDAMDRVEVAAASSSAMRTALAGVWSDPPTTERIGRFLALHGKAESERRPEPSGRPVRWVDFPDWLRPAVDAVVRDMQDPTPLLLKAWWCSPPDETEGWGIVRFTHADSEICEFQIPVVPQQASETELLLTIAAELPSAVSQLPQSRVQARPVCPGHSHPAMPVERDGAAWWACPRDGTLIGKIGTLNPGR
jgi:hypothetical protein